MQTRYVHIVLLKCNTEQFITLQTAKDNFAVRYALGVLDGKFQGREVFEGILHAIVDAEDRKSRGVGLQNFAYDANVEEFAQYCFIVSPQVYRFMSTQLQLPTIRGQK